MVGLFDYLLMLPKHNESFDDQSLEFRRVAGSHENDTVVFLPWSMRFETARALGITPAKYHACYELPAGIVSSTPNVPVESLHVLHHEFKDDIVNLQRLGKKPRLIGMSMGNFPATFLANRYQLPLLSIASGHRGDWLTFHSPAARHIKYKAEAAGFSEEDFIGPLHDLNPIQNLGSLGLGSTFLFGAYDKFIPPYSRGALITKLTIERPDISVRSVPFGHMVTIMLWKHFCDRAWSEGTENADT